jgi:hypothetical protein
MPLFECFSRTKICWRFIRVSRAAFRVLFDMTSEGDAKAALAAHIKKVGAKRFNEETNFLKHADVDPEVEINEDFHVLTEAGIGTAIGL